MGRTADGQWSEEWTPPAFSVDANGKVIGYVNDRTPNNWGRWGELDEKGTVNLITPDKIARAGALIQTGEVISCAIPLDSTGPVHPTRTGVVHLYGYTGADFVAGSVAGKQYPNFQGTDDYIFMPLQGSTQWDGMAHFFYKDTMYNGFWIGNVESFAGARRGSIHHLKNTLVGRGVFLDLPRLRGVERLEQGYAITPADLDAAAEAHGVEIGEGDILVVRTGHVPWFYSLEDKSQFWTGGAPGLSKACVEWLHEKDVAALAMDNIAIEVEPFEEGAEHVYPIHARLIRDLGLTLGEVWWLEDLSEACARDGRYEFFISAPPLNVTNASGSPANPVVIK
ncbi:cyclase family protein [Blastococcus saxobsidens]|uniref:Cyclase family protein n=1 Tax=Blastococcus saxobsidens TaxID=138336 RepID=A0A6L9W0C9_9ACTN|nr:cyclase family protein [Blastococcus saxobsidens]NEK85232.1 cyclase family protein [Blastococcus saxobsidens]